MKANEPPVAPPVSPDLLEEVSAFYIRTPAAFADDRNLVLKEGETFAVFDRYGDICPDGLAEEGLYHTGARYLSRLALRIGGERPLRLSAAVKQDNALIAVDLTNPDLDLGGAIIPRGTVHILRTLTLWDATLHERLRLRNYGASPLVITLTLVFAADFADIFEVRGTTRPVRGELLPPVVDTDAVVLGYRGLDAVTRRTRILVRPWSPLITGGEIRLEASLAQGAEEVFDLSFACERDAAKSTIVSVPEALSAVADALATRREAFAEITTSNTQVNEWIERSLADLAMMITDTHLGPVPYAGVPWFSAPFGRDSIITALQCLWVAPAVARGVLGYLAVTQATDFDAERDAQPGKILHEARDGEMAALKEIPFGRYYGSHDSTPLFVMLASAYFDRTGDQPLIDRLWPHIEAALHWIDQHGDVDADGFAEYLRESPDGLVNQGWKDSHDSVFHSDGQLAVGPIALCEIQSYVYAAWRGAARLARIVGRGSAADALLAKATALRERFDDRFWSSELGTYALALDGQKQPCNVATSNAGHALFTGIALHERAQSVARSLLSPDGFSGWGIRTASRTASRYNPMSYHNGSVWPHDNALIASGFSRYGLRDEALVVFDGLFQASVYMDLHRLPELFCGLRRRHGEGPTLYPVACSPQSWAAGSVFLLLQAILGIEVQAQARVVRLTRARLPPYIDEVSVRNLRIGPSSVDLLFSRHDTDVGIHVLRRDGDVEIVSIK